MTVVWLIAGGAAALLLPHILKISRINPLAHATTIVTVQVIILAFVVVECMIRPVFKLLGG